MSGFPIFAEPSATRATVLANLPVGTHPRFITEMLPALWDAALRYGIDPRGLVAQAGKETALGNYTGMVDPEAHNTCGLKLSPEQQRLYPGVTDDDNPLAHSMWTDFYVGAIAHAQHVWAWGDRPRSELPDLLIDPRWRAVKSLIPTRGKAVTWADLGGRWTTSETYGQEIEGLMIRLRGGT